MILALLIGCSGGGLEAFLPKVKFSRLDLVDLDFDQAAVDFVFEVDNPNPVGVPLTRFNYALGFEGIEVLSGDDPEGVEIRADDASELALPIGLDFAGLYDVVQATRGLDFIGFGLAGGFGFDTDLGPVEIAFDEEGSFPALRVPKIDLGDLEIRSADASGVEFGLGMNVDNDHGSALDFQNLDFDVTFAGAHVGAGSMSEVGSVPGASTETVSIPFGISFTDAAAALAAGAAGEPLDVALEGAVDVDTPYEDMGIDVVPLSFDAAGDVAVRDESRR